MNALWLSIAGLLLLSILMIFVPVVFWRRRNHLNNHGPNSAEGKSSTEQKNSQRENQNLTIFNENIAELAQQLANGLISQQDHDQLKLETERNLLVDIPESDAQHDSSASRPTARNTFIVAIMLCAVIPVASVYLYFQWGSADRVAELEQLNSGEQVGERRGPAGKRDFSQLADQLEAKLQDSPDDITGWLLLAKTRMSLGEYARAAEIYRSLIDKAETDKNRGMVLGLYAQAEFFMANQLVTPEVLRTIERALQADPFEVTALGLKGVDAFAKQNYSEAISNWQLAADNTANEENRQTLLRGVEEARQRMSVSDSNSSTTPSQNFGSLLVELSIQPKLLEGLDPDLWVYVFAKAVNGPRQHLAANRFRVSDLPLRVTLDDSMAMSPNLKVSSFAQVEVVARVSKSGEPIASKNDLQGSITLTRKGSSQTGIPLLIDTIIP